MSLLGNYSKEILSILTPLVLAAISYLLRPRAKLIWSVTNSRVMTFENQETAPDGTVMNTTGLVRTGSIFIKNAGPDAETAVEVVFNWKPPHLNVWPQRDYTKGSNPDGRHILKFPDLAPKEFIGIEVLCVNELLPEIIQVRSAQQGSGNRVETLHKRFIRNGRRRSLFI